MVGPPTNPPDPSPVSNHNHEWRPTGEGPLIEDGAAIFYEYCDWVEITGSSHSKKLDETFYETGAECEETRSYRFEYSTLESPQGKIFELPTISEWDSIDDEIQERIMTLEQRDSEDVEMSIDPDKNSGEVTIEYEGWKLTYEP